MISEFLMNQAKGVVPELEWTVNFFYAEETKGQEIKQGIVYDETGAAPSLDDVKMRYPEYMIYIRSSDWQLAERAAKRLAKFFHLNSDIIKDPVTEDEDTYKLYQIECTSEPIRIGVNDHDVMEYSVNLRVNLRII